MSVNNIYELTRIHDVHLNSNWLLNLPKSEQNTTKMTDAKHPKCNFFRYPKLNFFCYLAKVVFHDI